MYNTIRKANSNADWTIVEMIIAGFTGQLKGWWDNYLTQDHRNRILSAVKDEPGTARTTPGQNVVYSLVINIIEYFSGRWSDNSENIRTMLQNLRCKTLTSFRWYKDVFLSRAMELPECNNTHWMSKFMDGLPSLFAERVRKALRKGETNIKYDDEYTYGKLIGHYYKDCKVKQKINSLNIDEELKDTLSKLLLNSELEDSGVDPDTSENSTSNEDLKVLENESYISSDSNEECAPYQIRQPCSSKGNKVEE
ncbi:uncharacterized protein LOC132628669 [Lycium barbarum]|uniref:uncharacterized protein LOC132628669 n=1 Tax=Lycium barbarum TaxID=112863 RepID=UPI00293E5BA7|nr:uncharacterized protein LOC132628669 [Lycium barbarum]